MKLYKLYSILILMIFIINILAGSVLGIEYTNNIEILDNITADNETIYDKVENSDNEIIEDTNEIIEDEEYNVIQNDTIEENIIQEDAIEEYGIMTLNSSPDLGIKYRTHVQDVGWQNYVQDGKMSGTEGKALRLEGINIQLLNNEQNLNIKYQVHIQDIGWQSWKKNGEMAGTEGRSLRLEAIKISLEDSDDYSIKYRVHVQDIGWQDWKKDGEMAGTSGRALRLEAIEIQIIPKEKKGALCLDAPLNNSTYYSSSNIDFSGWKMANVSNTYIKAYIDNKEVDSKLINYFNREDVTNAIQNYGTATQNPKAGFKFTVNTNDLSSGSHIIKIDLYFNNTILTTLTSNFKVDKNLHVKYRSHVQDIGWQGYTMDGGTSGTSGKSYRVEAMNIELINAPSDAKILYRTHIQDIGWQDWKENGQLSGTEGRRLRVEAIEIKLQNMEKYTVEYQVHIQDIGWTDWYIDGEMAGTFGKSKRIEAIRIRIVPYYKRNYKGIDVSQFNGNINWGFVKRDNVDFAMIRVGYRGYGQAGNFAEDTMFKRNIEAAKNAKIPVGIYFVTQAITDAEAVEEANWVLEKIKNYDIDYPIAIDIEDSPGNPGRADNLDKQTRTRLAKIFCETIKNAGYTPMIYVNIYWAQECLDMSKLSEYDTWIAHYKYDVTSKPNYNKPYTIWQYSDKGSINGVLGNVDLNICYKKY